ncbi:MAG: hypothetical protein M3367_12855 [Acidobacteriota bacterium]|nr:hypothetical protein [Acidobacteriota bacterium]
MNNPRTRRLKIVAQDPGIKGKDGKILTAEVNVPAEEFAPGPSGYRVHVIDFDASTGSHYIPYEYPPPRNGQYKDPFDKTKTDRDILLNPHFHAQNAYAIVMRTLARFEFALGRRVSWGFGGHQINVAPHAFADANAFYSEHDRALMFGYFRSPYSKEDSENKEKLIFSCLSHDVVAHETTHALLDGLRKRYTTPSSPEQAGFHEGFADIVALLSVFSLHDIVAYLLDYGEKLPDDAANPIPGPSDPDLISVKHLTKEKLQNSILLGLADEMGAEMSGVRGQALRRSISIKSLSADAEPYLGQPAYEEPHRCGELLVAVMMNAFVGIWRERIEKLIKDDNNKEKDFVDRSLVAEAGANVADHLLTMAIRALDYTPPTDIKFADYVSAFLTADYEAVPDDSRFNYRQHVLKSFRDYKIEPASHLPDGIWEMETANFKYDRTHFDSLLREPNEVFRFIWDNRKALGIDERAYTRVESVRPCLRIAPDGFALRETVAEYVQMATVRAEELQQLYPPIGKPLLMPKNLEVTLYGGGTLIFDEYGQLKYHIANSIFSQKLQDDRLDYLWRYGFFVNSSNTENLFSRMHLRRAAIFSNHFVEEEF